MTLIYHPSPLTSTAAQSSPFSPPFSNVAEAAGIDTASNELCTRDGVDQPACTHACAQNTATNHKQTRAACELPMPCAVCVELHAQRCVQASLRSTRATQRTGRGISAVGSINARCSWLAISTIGAVKPWCPWGAVDSWCPRLPLRTC